MARKSYLQAREGIYVYRGDRLTDPRLRNAGCRAVRRADGGCITGRSAMLVLFDGEDVPRVVQRRQLRKAPGGKPGKIGKTDSERFDEKWIPEPNSGCWLWMATLNSWGYGWFWWPGGQRAHRFSWERENGPIPSGMVLDHICRTRSCVNPSHLRVVTIRQNTLENNDCCAAVNARKTHCKHGHPFSGDNLYIDESKGHARRQCRTCKQAKVRSRTPTQRGTPE